MCTQGDVAVLRQTYRVDGQTSLIPCCGTFFAFVHGMQRVSTFMDALRDHGGIWFRAYVFSSCIYLTCLSSVKYERNKLQRKRACIYNAYDSKSATLWSLDKDFLWYITTLCDISQYSLWSLDGLSVICHLINTSSTVYLTDF